MGRKPKNIDNRPMAAGNPYMERVEPKPSSAQLRSPRLVDSQLENSNPMGSPLKYPNPSVDVTVTHNERSPAQEHNRENGPQKKSSKHIKKKPVSFGSVRRSERIKSAVVHTPRTNGGIEFIDDESESEKDEPATQMEQVLSELEPEPEPEPAENLRENRSGETLEHVLQRVEALEKITTFLKSKVEEINAFYAAPTMESVSYQSLYNESQKKVEALTAKLENALGKIEVYEKEHRVLVEVLDKMKDAVNASLVSNLAKATEAAVNASTQALRTAHSASKRKRNEGNL